MVAGLLVRAVAVASVVAADHSVRSDLSRARQRVPRDAWRGSDFSSMSQKLTAALQRSGHTVRPCETWSVPDLQRLQRLIFQSSEADLLRIYSAATDKRRQRFETIGALESHWAPLDAAARIAGLDNVRRDGLCHEAVMWWVHHLSITSQRRLTREGVVLPSLSQLKHTNRAGIWNTTSSFEADVFTEYDQQLSCQQCHTGNISNPELRDASLAPPLPADKQHPGRERIRSCDFQNQPRCGPCEGLGGRRWGDGPEDMEPMQCEVLSGSETPATTRGMYPALGSAELTSDTRFPLSGHHSSPGTYRKIRGSLFLGWTDHLMRMRYDFVGLGSQVSIQSFEQAQRHDVGATVGISSKSCICDASIAGNMHIHSFEASDPLDPIKLPSDKGGVAYLGRVRVTLDGDTPTSKRTAIADHYLKWAFHFLVDADLNSTNFGLPLRLYASWGVRQVFEPWNLTDPQYARPDVWKMPANCTIKASACSIFEAASDVPFELLI